MPIRRFSWTEHAREALLHRPEFGRAEVEAAIADPDEAYPSPRPRWPNRHVAHKLVTVDGRQHLLRAFYEPFGNDGATVVGYYHTSQIGRCWGCSD